MKTIFAGVFFLATLGMAVAITPDQASAKEGSDAIITAGVCSRSNADWKLKVKLESPRLIELESEIDQANPGQLWNVKLSQNGVIFFNQNLRVNSLGNIEVNRFRPNAAGTDRFGLRATGPGGQVCNGSIRL